MRKLIEEYEKRSLKIDNDVHIDIDKKKRRNLLNYDNTNYDNTIDNIDGKWILINLFDIKIEDIASHQRSLLLLLKEEGNGRNMNQDLSSISYFKQQYDNNEYDNNKYDNDKYDNNNDKYGYDNNDKYDNNNDNMDNDNKYDNEYDDHFYNSFLSKHLSQNEIIEYKELIKLSRSLAISGSGCDIPSYLSVYSSSSYFIMSYQLLIMLMGYGIWILMVI